MKIINRLAFLTAFLFIPIPISAIAADINLIDTNTQAQIRSQERQRLLRQQQELKPDARDAGE